MRTIAEIGDERDIDPVVRNVGDVNSMVVKSTKVVGMEIAAVEGKKTTREGMLGRRKSKMNNCLAVGSKMIRRWG
jgi:hypothetical protein